MSYKLGRWCVMAKNAIRLLWRTHKCCQGREIQVERKAGPFDRFYVTGCRCSCCCSLRPARRKNHGDDISRMDTAIASSIIQSAVIDCVSTAMLSASHCIPSSAPLPEEWQRKKEENKANLTAEHARNNTRNRISLFRWLCGERSRWLSSILILLIGLTRQCPCYWFAWGDGVRNWTGITIR